MRRFDCLLFVLVAASGMGCAGGPMSVRAPSPGEVDRIQNQGIEKIYVRPFGASGVKLEGAHGFGDQVAENKARWFPHLLVGLQAELAGHWPGFQVIGVGAGPTEHGRKVMESAGVAVTFAEEVPEDAFVITGDYQLAREVEPGAAWLAWMRGRSMVTVNAIFSKAGARIYSFTVDGRYQEGGFSWGYETLGANESAGRGIADVIWRLQSGQPIEAK